LKWLDLSEKKKIIDDIIDLEWEKIRRKSREIDLRSNINTFIN
jgi:hypothetical protein